MTENTNQTDSKACCEENPGFFKRLFTKVDQAMKAKAEDKAQSGCCCSSDEKADKDDAGKGSKCC